MSNFDFQDLEKRRPLWQDIAYFAGFVMMVYGFVHVGLNHNAYAQIAQFKFDTLKASVLEVSENLTQAPSTEAVIVEEKLERVATKAPVRTFRKKELKPRNQAARVFKDMNIYPSDNRLHIPRINKNVPLITVPQHQNWSQLEKNIQSGLQEGVVVHPVSHAPGNFGNFFVTGHSSYYNWDPGRFKDVFALLHEVKVGDLVEVYWEGKKYVYKIRAEEVVPPTAVEVLNQPKDKFLLTLMTCTPVGTNKNRLILTGELKDVQ